MIKKSIIHKSIRECIKLNDASLWAMGQNRA